MRVCTALTAACLLAGASFASAADQYRVEPLQESPPAEGVVPAIHEELADSGFKVIKGKNRTVLEFWPRKAWPVQADFSPSSSILYPFQMGDLVGLVRYPRKGEDFRGQQIDSGLYTARYALQPVDGNHIGTSDTRDFLLLVPAADDADLEPIDKTALFELSAKASGTTHPAMLSLLPAPADGGELPALAHNESRELWSVRFANPTVAGGQGSDLVVDLVVVGKAPE